MSDVEQNPSPDRHLYAGFMRQFDEARRTVAALDTVFRDGNVEAVQDAQRIIRQLVDRVQELEGKSPPSSVQPCEMGDICIGCTPRRADGGCPGSVQPEKEERSPLTDEQIARMWSWSQSAEAERTASTQQHAFARAIEAAHGIAPSPSMVGREGE